MLFIYYGNKGISVCENWHNYSIFKAWALVSGWQFRVSIHRINSKGNYEPSNCEFLTKAEHSKITGLGKRKIKT